jgi:hypothetical protein
MEFILENGISWEGIRRAELTSSDRLTTTSQKFLRSREAGNKEAVVIKGKKI